MLKMFKNNKKKEIVFRDYLVIATPWEMRLVKQILKDSLVNNSRKILKTKDTYEIYKNGKVAKIRFAYTTTNKLYLEGLRTNLALVSEDCPNDLLCLAMSTTLYCDGETLYLCDPAIKQVIGDILIFTEGVDVHVKAGL